MEMTELMTDPLVKMEQTETMMMTEQTQKIRKPALMGQTEKMEATETIEDSPDAGDGMAETMVMTEHMKPTEPLMKMTSIFAEVFWDVCRSWTL